MNRMNMANQMYSRGDEVSSGRRSGSTGPNVQRGSLTLPAKTLSRMRGLASLGKPGLIAAGGLGLFEIGRQGGFSPENLGRNGLYIPIGKHINKKDQTFISQNVKSIVKKYI